MRKYKNNILYHVVLELANLGGQQCDRQGNELLNLRG